jgi:hypothetical protein
MCILVPQLHVGVSATKDVWFGSVTISYVSCGKLTNLYFFDLYPRIGELRSAINKADARVLRASRCYRAARLSRVRGTAFK